MQIELCTSERLTIGHPYRENISCTSYLWYGMDIGVRIDNDKIDLLQNNVIQPYTVDYCQNSLVI